MCCFALAGQAAILNPTFRQHQVRFQVTEIRSRSREAIGRHGAFPRLRGAGDRCRVCTEALLFNIAVRKPAQSTLMSQPTTIAYLLSAGARANAVPVNKRIKDSLEKAAAFWETKSEVDTDRRPF